MKKLLVMVTALLNGIIYLSKSPMVELPWAFLLSSLEHKATGYAQRIYFEIGRLFLSLQQRVFIGIQNHIVNSVLLRKVFNQSYAACLTRKIPLAII